MSDNNDKDELGLNIYEAQWQWLKPHLERGALITVNPALDLATAGERIAADDSGQVMEWLERGALGKPTEDEIARWDEEPAKKFLALIVSPYVLIQAEDIKQAEG